VLDGVDLRALGGDGLELVGHELQVLGSRGLHAEDTTGGAGKCVDEVLGVDLLAGELLADQGVQHLVGLAGVASGHGESKAEIAGAIQVGAHLDVTADVGRSGKSGGGAIGKSRHTLVEGRLELLLGNSVAHHHHIAAHEVSRAVLKNVRNGKLLQVGSELGGAQGRLAVRGLEQELYVV